MNWPTRHVPQAWDRQATNGGSCFLKLPTLGRDPTIDDPPIAGLTAAVVEVYDKPGGTLRFPAVTCTVTAETGLIEWSIANNLVAAATWTTSYLKLIATINGAPYVPLDGRVSLKP